MIPIKNSILLCLIVSCVHVINTIHAGGTNGKIVLSRVIVLLDRFTAFELFTREQRGPELVAVPADQRMAQAREDAIQRLWPRRDANSVSQYAATGIAVTE